MRYPDGRIASGVWEKSRIDVGKPRPRGRGRITYVDGSTVDVALWVDAVPHGMGTKTSCSGSIVEGTFHYGEFSPTKLVKEKDYEPVREAGLLSEKWL